MPYKRKTNQQGFVALGCLVVLLSALAFFIYLNHRAQEMAPPPEKGPQQSQKKSPDEP